MGIGMKNLLISRVFAGDRFACAQLFIILFRQMSIKMTAPFSLTAVYGALYKVPTMTV